MMMARMEKSIAKKWVQALRSGEYEQGKQYLCDGTKYCCLGVLDAINPKLNLRGSANASLYNYKKVGLESPLGELPTNTDQPDIDLAVLNDAGSSGYCIEGSSTRVGRTAPLNFQEIADIIEAEYILEVMK